MLPTFDQRLGGNAEAFMQPPYHLQRQRPLASKDFVDAIATADKRLA
jgi:hypothetical protein